MKQNRRILFGYRLSGDGMSLHDTEAPVVRSIFCRCRDGASLKQLVDTLNESGIPYHESNPLWNKSAVYRMLTNSKYLGNDKYPRLVENEEFEAVAQQLGDRKKFRPASCSMDKAVRNKLFCACGARLKKETDNAWVCTSCSSASITANRLNSLIQEAFQQLQNDSSTIIVEPKEKEYTPTVEIMKLNNEIRRRIDSREADAEDVKADILRCAQLKYESFEEDLTPYISRTICEEFEKGDGLETSCVPLIEKTVASITLAVAGRIQIKFRNGAIITAGRR